MSQVVPEESAACAYPCETGRQCSSAGGILVENGNQISESQQEAETAYRQSSCYNQTAQANQTGTGQFGTGQTGAGQFGTGQTGVGQFGTGQTGTGQIDGVGTGQTAGGNQGSSSNTGGKLLSMISCAIQLSLSFEEAALIDFSVLRAMSFMNIRALVNFLDSTTFLCYQIHEIAFKKSFSEFL